MLRNRFYGQNNDFISFKNFIADRRIRRNAPLMSPSVSIGSWSWRTCPADPFGPKGPSGETDRREIGRSSQALRFESN